MNPFPLHEEKGTPNRIRRNLMSRSARSDVLDGMVPIREYSGHHRDEMLEALMSE